MRLLLVEDNEELATVLMRAFAQGGIVADHVADGLYAQQLLESEDYDAAVLDLELPRKSGLDVLSQIRRKGRAVPILILTAQAGVDAKVKALDLGADDYLSKPFDLAELEARLRALVRRSQGHTASMLQSGKLQYDASTRLFALAGKPLSLPPREHGVLEILMTHAGKPVSKKVLSDRLCTLDDLVSADAIEIYIHRLRRKLDDPSLEIRTLRGLGYLLQALDVEANQGSAAPQVHS